MLSSFMVNGITGDVNGGLTITLHRDGKDDVNGGLTIILHRDGTVSYTHLTLPTKRIV